MVLPAGDAAGVAAALEHGRVMVEATGPELAGVAHLDPRAELIWRPCAPRLPRHAPAAVAGVAGRPALVELAPAGWSIAPGASAWQLHAAGAAGVVAQPPRSPDAAAIWLDALLEGDRAGAILRALDGRCSADAATCVASLAEGGTELDAACRSFERGDGKPLAQLLEAWSRAADEVARLEDRRLARALAPRPASCTRSDGPGASPWRATTARRGTCTTRAWSTEDLGDAASRLLTCVMA